MCIFLGTAIALAMPETYEHDIDPHGDVILSLTDDDGRGLETLLSVGATTIEGLPPQTSSLTSVESSAALPRRLKIKVSSKHLSLASDLLRILFEKKKRVGRRNGLVEVEISADASAFVIVLHI